MLLRITIAFFVRDPSSTRYSKYMPDAYQINYLLFFLNAIITKLDRLLTEYG